MKRLLLSCLFAIFAAQSAYATPVSYQLKLNGANFTVHVGGGHYLITGSTANPIIINGFNVKALRINRSSTAVGPSGVQTTLSSIFAIASDCYAAMLNAKSTSKDVTLFLNSEFPTSNVDELTAWIFRCDL